MTEITKSTRVSDIVAQRPSTSRIMERHGLDYCCGGAQSLELACAGKGISVETVLADLQAAMKAPAEANLQTLPLPKVVDHVVSLHHGFLRETLPVVGRQLDRVVMVHGGAHPELAKAQVVFHRFAKEMMEHLEKEEKVLFPLICDLSQAKGLADIERIVAAMEAEHNHSGDDLKELRALLNNYEAPEGACGTYRAMLQGLADIEEDTHVHIHSENFVLFPRAHKEAQGLLEKAHG